ncbi:hypothetical protein B0H16DRAFT_1741029 [Mycena metata]|uniref:Uncharacterized protein n=1 Tax=Mycena metata TaxID=1033252 RepID=A0AAD7MGP0_9AGAR|nr:hypothetical protein B0H16DRAFT_1741029 [Mycena metata]
MTAKRTHDDDEMPSDEDWDECSPSDGSDCDNNDDMETDVDDKENIPVLAQEASALAPSKLADLIQTDGTTKPAGTTIVGYDTA